MLSGGSLERLELPEGFFQGEGDFQREKLSIVTFSARKFIHGGLSTGATFNRRGGVFPKKFLQRDFRYVWKMVRN